MKSLQGLMLHMILYPLEGVEIIFIGQVGLCLLTSCRMIVFLLEQGGFGEGQRVEVTSNNPFVRRAFLGYFEIVNRANLMIENIPRVDIPEVRKNRFLGEVRFLRAFANYHLGFFFNQVPLRETPIRTFEDGPIAASSLEQIQQSVANDLNFAIAALPWVYGPEDYGSATKGAAISLLAKQHMLRGEWTQAVSLLDQLVNGSESPHFLVPNYADVFDVEFKNHPEHIFSARFAGGLEALNEGGILELRYGPPPSQAPVGFLPGNSNAIARPTYDDGQNAPINIGIINVYLETNDPRLDHAYVNFRDGNPAEYFVDKFRDKTPHVAGNASNIFPLIRYADILLLYAEALNEVNTGPTPAAYEAINKVRRRANNNAPDGKTLGDIVDLDYSAFREAVFHERRMELAHEGHRWIDLVRTGRMESVLGPHLGRNIESFRNILPIPNAELDANPEMRQNPGY
jgi:starch-binding outer membrane protein, SusD/RagB family